MGALTSARAIIPCATCLTIFLHYEPLVPFLTMGLYLIQQVVSVVGYRDLSNLLKIGLQEADETPIGQQGIRIGLDHLTNDFVWFPKLRFKLFTTVGDSFEVAFFGRLFSIGEAEEVHDSNQFEVVKAFTGCHTHQRYAIFPRILVGNTNKIYIRYVSQISKAWDGASIPLKARPLLYPCIGFPTLIKLTLHRSQGARQSPCQCD